MEERLIFPPKNYIWILEVDSILNLDFNDKSCYNKKKRLIVINEQTDKYRCLLDDTQNGNCFLVAFSTIKEANALYHKISDDCLEQIHSGKKMVGQIIYNRKNRETYLLEANKRFIFVPRFYNMTDSKKYSNTKKEKMETTKDHSEKLMEILNLVSRHKQTNKKIKAESSVISNELENVKLENEQLVKKLDATKSDLDGIIIIEKSRCRQIDVLNNELEECKKKLNEFNNNLNIANQEIEMFYAKALEENIHISFKIVSFEKKTKVCSMKDFNNADLWANDLVDNSVYVIPSTGDYNICVYGIDHSNFIIQINDKETKFNSTRVFSGKLIEDSEIRIIYNGTLDSLTNQFVEISSKI